MNNLDQTIQKTKDNSQESVVVIDGFNPDVPVVAAHSGWRDDPETGTSIPMHFAYTGVSDEAITWQTRSMPAVVPTNGIILAFYAGLRKDGGAWPWFELRLGGQPLVRFRTPVKSGLRSWDFVGGQLLFEPHYRDKNGDHYGRMLLTLAAERVTPMQPLKLSVHTLQPEVPEPIDLVWKGRPCWESPRPFFMLLDRGEATQPRMLELTVSTEAAVCERWRGFGAQGDLFFRTEPLRKLGVNDDDVQLIHDRIREMKPQLVRLCCGVHAWEPELGKPDLHSEWLGIEAVLMWCLSDTNYGQSMKWGLWRFKGEGWEPRPGFYAWRLLTKHTALGSRVYTLAARGDSAPAVPAVAFEFPDGR